MSWPQHIQDEFDRRQKFSDPPTDVELFLSQPSVRFQLNPQQDMEYYVLDAGWWWRVIDLDTRAVVDCGAGAP